MGRSEADDVYGRPKVFLTDISQDALDVAEENAEGLRAPIRPILLGDGLVSWNAAIQRQG